MNQIDHAPESSPKPNTFSLLTVLAQTALIAVALACWKLINTKPSADQEFVLWSGFVIALATSLGGFCGSFTKGFILGVCLMVVWYILWQLVAMTGALS